MTLAYLFPGQGSQAVGMGKDLCERSAEARALFERADDVLGFPISKLCFEGPEEELRLTRNTQPALLVVSTAACRALGRDPSSPRGVSDSRTPSASSTSEVFTCRRPCRSASERWPRSWASPARRWSGSSPASARASSRSPTGTATTRSSSRGRRPRSRRPWPRSPRRGRSFFPSAPPSIPRSALPHRHERRRPAHPDGGGGQGRPQAPGQPLGPLDQVHGRPQGPGCRRLRRVRARQSPGRPHETGRPDLAQAAGVPQRGELGRGREDEVGLIRPVVR